MSPHRDDCMRVDFSRVICCLIGLGKTPLPPSPPSAFGGSGKRYLAVTIHTVHAETYIAINLPGPLGVCGIVDLNLWVLNDLKISQSLSCGC